MHILALETDIGKTKRSLMGKRESEVMTVHRHWLPFVFVALRETAYGLLLLAISFLLEVQGPAAFLIFSIWAVWTASGLFRAYIDWRFTFLFLTREKVVIIRQHVLRRRLLPITLNNIQSVEVVSQYWDLFGFGAIRIHLRESGEVLPFSYVPDSSRVAKMITNIVSLYNQQVGLWEQQSQQLPPAPPRAETA
jgi:hypothetical protein